MNRPFHGGTIAAARSHRKHGLRIDFVLGTPGVLDHVDDVVIDRDYRKKHDGLTASDHAPVWADITV